MNIKVVPIGIIAAFVFALVSAQPCFAIGGLSGGTPVGPMSGSPSYTRASPYAGDVPGEPQGREDNPWARRAAMEKTELHFDLSQCQQIEAGLYKCAVADKPICNPDYKGQAECVRIGPTGSVYVLSRFAY